MTRSLSFCWLCMRPKLDSCAICYECQHKLPGAILLMFLGAVMAGGVAVLVLHMAH